MKRSEFLVAKNANQLKWYRIEPNKTLDNKLNLFKQNKNIIPEWKNDEYNINAQTKLDTKVYACVPDTQPKSSKEKELVDLVLSKLDEIERILFGENLSKMNNNNDSYLYKSSLDGDEGMTCWRSNLINDKSISFTLNNFQPKTKIIHDKSPPTKAVQIPSYYVRIDPGRHFIDSNNHTRIPNDLLLKEINHKKSQLKKPDDNYVDNSTIKVDLVNEIDKSTTQPEVKSIDMDKLVDEKSGQTKYSFKVKLNLNESNFEQRKSDELVIFNLFNQNDDKTYKKKPKEPLIYKCQSENPKFKNCLLKLYFDLEELINQQQQKLNNKENPKNVLIPTEISHVDQIVDEIDQEIKTEKIFELEEVTEQDNKIELNEPPEIVDNRKFTERAGSILKKVQKQKKVERKNENIEVETGENITALNEINKVEEKAEKPKESEDTIESKKASDNKNKETINSKIPIAPPLPQILSNNQQSNINKPTTSLPSLKDTKPIGKENDVKMNKENIKPNDTNDADKNVRVTDQQEPVSESFEKPSEKSAERLPEMQTKPESKK
jgi:hypothetical protein